MRQTLIKTHRTMIDAGIIVGITLILIFLWDIINIKTLILFGIWTLAMLCDIFFTWIPTSVLSEEQRGEITNVIFFGENRKEIYLSKEDIVRFETLCQKKTSYHMEKDTSLTGIGFKVPLEETVFYLYQSSKRTNCFFYTWENDESRLRDILIFNEEEMAMIHHFIRVYNQ